MATLQRFWIDGGTKKAEPAAKFQQDTFNLAMLSVGPGEAIFLEAGKKAGLVDGGAKNKPVNSEVAATLESWIEARDLSLKLFIASHPHVDHLNALPALLQALPESRYAPAAAFYDNGQLTSGFVKALVSQVKGLKFLKRIVPVSSQIVSLGPRTRVKLFMGGHTQHGPAYQSVFALVEHGEARFLLTGDSYQDYEKTLIDAHPDWLTAHVLKITHHGSEGGTSAAFLDVVNPAVAVASTARKPGGQMDPSHNIDKGTADRLKSKGVKVFETATAGTIIVTTDGVRQPDGILFQVMLNE